jgi:hypothetical protein
MIETSKAEKAERLNKQRARSCRREMTAYHEAGHAVIARVLTLAPERASIRPNYRKGRDGHCIIRDPYAAFPREWLKRGHPDAE